MFRIHIIIFLLFLQSWSFAFNPTKRDASPSGEIEKVLMPFLPQELPTAKRQKKISNVLVELSTKDQKIKNISQSIKYSVWKLSKD